MSKAKLIIISTEDKVKTEEKYICNLDDDCFTYTDKQKTQYEVRFANDYLTIKTSGHFNYEVVHQSAGEHHFEIEIKFAENQQKIATYIENKYYKLTIYDKIIRIDIHFLREDNTLIKKQYNVEVK